MLWRRGTSKNFCACECASVEDIHAIALITLCDYSITRLDLDLFDGIKNNIEFTLVERIEHEGLQQLRLKLCLHLFRLGEHRWNKVFFPVMFTKHFCRDARALFHRPPDGGNLFLLFIV